MTPEPIIGLGSVVEINGQDARVIGIARDGCTFRFLADGRKITVGLAMVERSFACCSVRS